ncbi:MAG: bacterial transcriptional activator domain-containing protein, partial [Planctomycetota bacterium]
SDSARALGDGEMAVRHAWGALRIDPTNEGFWAYLVLGLHTAGRFQEAADVLERLPAIADLDCEHSVLRTYLKAYPAFVDLARRVETSACIQRVLLDVSEN